jgi:hypothetical protein
VTPSQGIRITDSAEVQKAIRSAVMELQPLLQQQAPPPKSNSIFVVALLSGLVSAIVVTGAFLVLQPSMRSLQQEEPPTEMPVPSAQSPVPQPAVSSPLVVSQPVPVPTSPKVPESPAPVVAAKPKPVSPKVTVAPAAPKDDFERAFTEPAVAKEPNALPETLEHSAIMAVVLENKAEAADCVRRFQPEDSDAPRKLVMRWTIRPSGETADITSQTPELTGTPLEDCLRTLIGKWKFPKHQQEGEPFSFPFRLETSAAQ